MEAYQIFILGILALFYVSFVLEWECSDPRLKDYTRKAKFKLTMFLVLCALLVVFI